MNARESLVALNMIPNIGPVRFRQLLQQFGDPVQILTASKSSLLRIDGISETDGLEVTSRNLGPGFKHGAMIAQDGRNVLPVENQNYKYVPWESIAKALKLEMR